MRYVFSARERLVANPEIQGRKLHFRFDIRGKGVGSACLPWAQRWLPSPTEITASGGRLYEGRRPGKSKTIFIDGKI